MRVQFEGMANASTSTQLPQGPFAFAIDMIDPDYESKEKQTKGLEVKCHVIDGVDFEDGSSTIGLQRTMRFWYPNKGQKDGGKFCLGRLNEFVQSCGLDTSDDGFDAEDLVGQQFKCRVKIKTDEQGRENEEYVGFKAY